MIVRQTWIAGEKWWRDYERFVDKRLNLRARLLEPAGFLGEKVRAPKNASSSFPFRRDPRLQATFRLVTPRAGLEDLIDHLETVTKLKFTISKELTHHRPAFGSINLPEARSWVVMELIAETDINDGRWERTEAGYCLVGKSLLPTPPAGPNPWLIGGAAVLGLALFFGMLVYLRHRLPPRRLS